MVKSDFINNIPPAAAQLAAGYFLSGASVLPRTPRHGPKSALARTPYFYFSKPVMGCKFRK
jgi:hypothetical protein